MVLRASDKVGYDGVNIASSAQRGIVQLSTSAQASAASDDSTAMTPSKVVESINANTTKLVYGGDEKAEATASGLKITGQLSTDSISISGSLSTNSISVCGSVNMDGATIQGPTLIDYSENVVQIGDDLTPNVNLELGNVFTDTIATTGTTYTFSNPPASGSAGSFTLILTNGGSQTVTWPASVQWAGGSAASLTASGTDVLEFMTIDGGTVWYAFAAGLDMQ